MEKIQGQKRDRMLSETHTAVQMSKDAPHILQCCDKVLKAAGILMSVSAGNNGPFCGSIDTAAAFEPLVFTVGALSHRSQRIASFSSRGPVFVRGMSGTVVKPTLWLLGTASKEPISMGKILLSLELAWHRRISLDFC